MYGDDYDDEHQNYATTSLLVKIFQLFIAFYYYTNIKQNKPFYSLKGFFFLFI